MARIGKDGTKIYQTEDRQYKVKDQLLNSMFACMDGIKDVIVTANKNDPYDDPRIEALTLYLTTFTLSENSCLKMIKERAKMIEDEVDFTEDKAVTNRKLFMVNIKTIVKCQASFDNYYGIKKRQEIMRMESPAIKKAKEKFGGDELLGLMFAGGKQNE